MKKFSNKLKSLLVVSMVFVPVLLMADDGGFGGGSDDVLDNPVPFDGGVTMLVAAGVAYGLKKVHDKRKAEKL